MAIQALYKRYLDLEGFSYMFNWNSALAAYRSDDNWNGGFSRVENICKYFSSIYANLWKIKRRIFTAMWLENHKTIYWIVEFADDFYEFITGVVVINRNTRGNECSSNTSPAWVLKRLFSVLPDCLKHDTKGKCSFCFLYMVKQEGKIAMVILFSHLN